MPNRSARRQSPARYPTSLEVWNHDALVRGLELPAVGDGPARQVDLQIPNLATLALQGRMPNRLVPIALKVADGLTLTKLEEGAEQADYHALMCWVIATHLRKPDLMAEYADEEAASQAVADLLPDDHKWAIWQRCVHVFEPTDILEAMSKAGLLKEVQGSEVRSVTDLARFPSQPNGGPADAPGERATGTDAQ